MSTQTPLKRGQAYAGMPVRTTHDNLHGTVVKVYEDYWKKEVVLVEIGGVTSAYGAGSLVRDRQQKEEVA